MASCIEILARCSRTVLGNLGSLVKDIGVGLFILEIVLDGPLVIFQSAAVLFEHVLVEKNGICGKVDFRIGFGIFIGDE